MVYFNSMQHESPVRYRDAHQNNDPDGPAIQLILLQSDELVNPIDLPKWLQKAVDAAGLGGGLHPDIQGDMLDNDVPD